MFGSIRLGRPILKSETSTVVGGRFESVWFAGGAEGGDGLCMRVVQARHERSRFLSLAEKTFFTYKPPLAADTACDCTRSHACYIICLR